MPLNILSNALSEEEKKKQQQSPLQPGAGMLGGPTTTEFDPSTAFASMKPTATSIPVVGSIRDTSGLQFNPEFASRNVALQRQEADLGLQKNQGLAQVNQQYERQTELAAQQQKAARQKLLEKMSGQGILASGITGQQGSELQTAFQRFLDDLGYSKAASQAGVESQYAQMMNAIAGQREGLYGEQRQVEEQRRLEAARQAAEAAARQQEAQRNAQLMAEAEAQRQAQQANMAALIQAMQPPQIVVGGYGGGGGGGGGGGAAPPPSAWNQQDILRTYQNAFGGGNTYQQRMNQLGQWYQGDPAWAQMAQATAGQYGRGNDTASILDFFTNPWNWVPGMIGSPMQSNPQSAGRSSSKMSQGLI